MAELLFNDAEYLFHQGTNYYAYKYLGVSKKTEKEIYVYKFRAWAPNADSIAIVSDFLGWENPLPMRKISKGVWESEYKANHSLHGCAYKFLIEKNGEFRYKGDPYARYSCGGSDGASIIFESSFLWSDDAWLKKRRERYDSCEEYLSIPINVYEIHLGSFMRKDDGAYLSYRELADTIIPYVRYMGYTHVELLPIFEYPYDGSWGYQVGAFFAPTSRFGNPDDFKYFINEFHTHGIGVILDWVPAHFPKDEWGLYEFDGTPLYEYQGADRMESATWGTRFFDIGREEVQSFLVSNALYYFREFHIDGLRVDAVAAMLYLDYDRTPGEWIPNCYGTRENLEAIAFFQKLNSRVFLEFPEALMIAEESGDFGKITHPVQTGGLGFNLKWNMGWANDLYDYLKTDPIYREYKHTALNFPIMYAFSENYILPFSHDEVVHGKLSLINKMHGDYEDKFKQLRAAIMLMMTYPGKKMMFMGCEYGQFREWDHKNSLEWFMLDYDKHTALREYVASINHFYIEHSELWENDFSYSGFEWILSDEKEKNLVFFKRKSRKNSLIILISFSGKEETVQLRLNENLIPECVFSTGESGERENLILSNDTIGNYVDIKIPPFSGRIYTAENKKITLK